jgi:hypothetical protein
MVEDAEPNKYHFKQYTTGLTSGQKQQWEKLQWELLRQDEL